MTIETYDLEEIERMVIVKCVDENKEASSRKLALLLNISERTLFRRMNKYQISLKAKPAPPEINKNSSTDKVIEDIRDYVLSTMNISESLKNVIVMNEDSSSAKKARLGMTKQRK